MRLLTGYMILSCVTLLGTLGSVLAHDLIDILPVCDLFVIDAVTWTFVFWNFAAVGVVSIFYQHGIPMFVKQT